MNPTHEDRFREKIFSPYLHLKKRPVHLKVLCVLRLSAKIFGATREAYCKLCVVGRRKLVLCFTNVSLNTRDVKLCGPAVDYPVLQYALRVAQKNLGVQNAKKRVSTVKTSL